MQPTHAAIVYNPVKVKLDVLRRAVAEQEREHDWAPSRWYETDSEDAGRRAAEEALAAGPGVVIAAGGDGTVRIVADVVHATGTSLALLPSGTGNLLARNLGLALNDIDGSIAAAFGDRRRMIDVAVAELQTVDGARRTEVFLVMAGIGLDAEMAENTSSRAKKHLGWMAYVLPIARSILGTAGSAWTTVSMPGAPGPPVPTPSSSATAAP